MVFKKRPAASEGGTYAGVEEILGKWLPSSLLEFGSKKRQQVQPDTQFVSCKLAAAGHLDR